MEDGELTESQTIDSTHDSNQGTQPSSSSAQEDSKKDMRKIEPIVWDQPSTSEGRNELAPVII